MDCGEDKNFNFPGERKKIEQELFESVPLVRILCNLWWEATRRFFAVLNGEQIACTFCAVSCGYY